MLANQSTGAHASVQSGDLHVAMSMAHTLWSAGQGAAAARQYELVGHMLAARGETRLALSTFRTVASLAPHCRDTQLRCAEQYFEVGARTEAIAIWEWAAENLRLEGRIGEAAHVLARAVEASPADPQRRVRLADLYLQLPDRTAAVEQLHAAGTELLRRRRYRGFLDNARRLLACEPRHVSTLRATALAHLRLRDLWATFEALRALLAVSRGDAVAGELLVELLVVAGRAGAGAKAAELVAGILLAQGDAPSLMVARRVVDRARRRYPDAAVFVRLQAELSTEFLDDDAIEVLEESLSVRRQPPSQEAAWEKTGVFQLVAQAMREEGQTNVRGPRRGRKVEDTRPDGIVAAGRLAAG